MEKRRLTECELKEIVSEEVQKLLLESTLNRVLSWMKDHEIACITAFRNEFENSTPRTLDDRPQELKDMDKERGITKTIDKTPYKYKTSEKKKRNRDLKAALLSLGYGVTDIHGNYIENYGKINAIELGEESFFVVNLNNSPNFKEVLFDLSEYYNQDGFLYKPKGSNVAYNIGTNYWEYPGYRNEDNLGVLHINIDNEFLSRVGNSSFSFTNDDEPKRDTKERNFQSRKTDRVTRAKKRNKIIQESIGFDTYDRYSRISRMSIKAIFETINKNMNRMKKGV